MIEINPFTLRNILSSRAIFTTISEKISYELVNENTIFQLNYKYSYNHNVDIITTSIVMICAINMYMQPLKQKEKLATFEYYTNIQNITSKFIFIFMLIFTKNIESVV
jgi:predicted RNA binding protein with dsRBD fold (UPF0201 family)